MSNNLIPCLLYLKMYMFKDYVQAPLQSYYTKFNLGTLPGQKKGDTL